jgi:hypothetical protein
VRATVEGALERLATAGRAETELLLHLIEEIFEVTSRTEATVAMVTSGARRLSGAIDDWHFADLLRNCARAAIANDDSLSLGLVLDQVEGSLLDAGAIKRGPIVDLSSEIVSVACWRSYSIATPTWQWWWETTEQLGGSFARRLGAVRVGAAALESGVLSLALTVAFALRSGGHDVQQLREALKREDVFVRERALADLNGGYLGSSPLDALERFGDLMVAAATHTRA